MKCGFWLGVKLKLESFINFAISSYAIKDPRIGFQENANKFGIAIKSQELVIFSKERISLIC